VWDGGVADGGRGGGGGRGYTERKIQENVACEIMQVVRTEAHDSYRADVLLDMPSDTLAQMEENVRRVVEFFEAADSDATPA
jgi:broad-specificity NMP kinase